MDQKCFESVCDQARQAAVLHSAADALEWDERTRMPPAAGQYRAEQVSALRAAVHRLKTDTEYGHQLQALSEQTGSLDPHGDQAATVRILFRDWQQDTKLPTELVQKISAVTVMGQQRWDQAKKDNDYASFVDVLSEILQLKREVGSRLAEGTEKSVYEALLDEYEPDASEAQIDEVFRAIRGPLVDLIQQIGDAPVKPNVDILKREYSVDAQRRFSRHVAEQVGFDFQRGRLDETSHPFCTTLGPDDCRILTRYDSHWLPGGLFGTLHEAGHGMYEQGLRTDWFGLPPGSYVSLGIHESQSRLWENQVGRSRAFWQWLFPRARESFEPILEDVSLDEFYFAANSVQPSLIRVEADEATYNLHILIRFDLERQLINGSLSVQDLPDAWNDRYESDLGIRPQTFAEGVLQDVHWSAGLIGYFPTYTLGNLAGAQLFDAAAGELGDLDEMFQRGEFQPLRDWLRRHVYRFGRCYNGQELIQHATGKPLSSESLVNYLCGKLKRLYQVIG